jgi:arylmalonate decarboxylase
MMPNTMHDRTRRHLLALLGGLSSAAILPSPLLAANAGNISKLGLLIPPANGTLPGEAASMYSGSMEFLIESLGLESMTPDGYDAVLDRIAPQAELLAQRGAQGILLMGTSLSFYKGQAFNEQLTQSLVSATGLPSMTMSTAVIEGLRAVGGKRLVAATAYNDEVHGRLEAFLIEHGFQVPVVKGLEIEAIGDLNSVTPQQLIRFCSDVAAMASDADAMLISCGGLPTLEILAPVESRTGIPAVTSTPHALWAGARLLGVDSRMPGYGQLLSI